MPDIYSALGQNDSVAWKMVQRYHRTRAELLIGEIQAKAVIRLTDKIAESLESSNTQHLAVLEGFSNRRASAFSTLSRSAGASRFAGRRLAIALNALRLLER